MLQQVGSKVFGKEFYEVPKLLCCADRSRAAIQFRTIFCIWNRAADIKLATKEKLQKPLVFAYGFTLEFRANSRANGARQFCAPLFLARNIFAQ
jgi:hypothetical protein